jgi:hypothetical protein
MPQVQPDRQAANPLDSSVELVRIYGDACSDPAQSDVQRLCYIWAEVGRAILARRKQSSEAREDQKSHG